MAAPADPLGLCRMNRALVARIAAGEGLGRVAGGALLAIVFGAGSYGGAFGLWRAPEQALYSGLKLPVLMLAVVLTAALVNALLATLLRARLGFRQCAVAILVGFATTSTLLGALAPVTAAVVASLPGPDPLAVGLPLTDPVATAANRSAQGILLGHVFVIAVAGVMGNLRLYALLVQLDGRRAVVRRVLAAWLAIELLVGSQLSWMLRPFLGRPHRTPELVSDVMFEGSFFEELGDALVHAMGVPALVLGALVLLAFGAGAWAWMRSDGVRVELRVRSDGAAGEGVEGTEFVPWSRVRGVSMRRSSLAFDDAWELVLALADGRRWLVRVEDSAERDALLNRVTTLCEGHPGDGPFRVQT
ncbi:MAG: hypothetical protein AB8I08_07900 [Sandaracinaceae bacterium]